MGLEKAVEPGHAEFKRLLWLRSSGFILRALDSLCRVLRETETKGGAAVNHAGCFVEQRWVGGQIR